MAEEKKYSGYGYHGGGRKATGIKRYQRKWQHLGGVKKPHSSRKKTAAFFIFFIVFVLTQNKIECIL